MTAPEPPSEAPVEQPPGTATITPCPNGPLLIRGPVQVVTVDGSPVPGQRPTMALCRCGASAAKPFCDGSHKAIGFTAP